MPPRGELELLQLELDLLRLSDVRELVIACARDGTCVRASPSMPDDLVHVVSAELSRIDAGIGLDSPPPQLERWRRLMEEAIGEPVVLGPGSGPSYVVHDELTYATEVRLVRSDSASVNESRDANPGNWGADEWVDLLEGRLGPWVMAMHEARVVSICHTPTWNQHAAEAGTWTHPDFRGRGYAAAATAEWATLLRHTGRVLFYSTSQTNRSSQAVAARLRLRHIGCLWQLRRANATGARIAAQRGFS